MSISKRILAIILTIIFTAGLNGITVISTYLMLVFSQIYRVILVLTLLVIFIVIITVSNVVALRNYKFKEIYKGIVFTIIYFIIFTIGFLIYIEVFSNFKIVYGVLAFLFILMFYIYCLSIGLIIGIYLNCKKIGVFSLVLFE